MFFGIDFFYNINFWITLFSKMIPNFWHLPIQYTSFQNSVIFFWVCWFLGKIISYYVPPQLKNSTTRITIASSIFQSDSLPIFAVFLVFEEP